MRCTECGTKVEHEGARFCPNCGEALAPEPAGDQVITISQQAGAMEGLSRLIGIQGDLNPGRDIVIMLSRERNRARTLRLPEPVATFVGRQGELASLEAAVRGTVDGTVALIHGPAGVGKSELALALARRLRDRYPDLQLRLVFQPGGEPLSPTAAAQQLLQQLDPALPIPEDSAPQLFERLRAALEGRDALLLFENAADLAQLAPLLPPPRGTLLLVTTRERFDIGGAHVVALAPLPAGDARELLRRILAGSTRAALADDEAGLERLAAACGYLPLALDIAARFLTNEGSWTLDGYIAALEERPLDHLHAGDRRVGQVLGMGVATLAEQAPELAERWHLAATLVPGWSLEAAAALWAVDHDVARDAISALWRRHLVESEEGDERYAVPELLRQLARDAPSAPGHETQSRAWRRLARYLLEQGRAAVERFERGEADAIDALARFDALLPQLEQAWDALLDSDDEQDLTLLDELPGALYPLLLVRRFPNQLLPRFEAGLEAARTLDRPQARHLGLLAQLAMVRGDTARGADLFARAIERAGIEGDRESEGRALYGLAVCRAQGRELDEALALLHRALEVGRESDVPTLVLNALLALGWWHIYLRRPQVALDYYTQALELAEAQRAPRLLGTTLSYLGAAHATMGQVPRAAEFHRRALTIWQEIEDRRSEAVALSDLGLDHMYMKQFDRAVELQGEALAIWEEIGEVPGRVPPLVNLGLALMARGTPQEAVPRLEEAARIAGEIENPHAELTVQLNLGNARALIRDHAAALRAYRRAHELAGRTGNRQGEAESEFNIALTYVRLDQFEDALRHAESALTILDEIQHPQREARRLQVIGWQGLARLPAPLRRMALSRI